MSSLPADKIMKFYDNVCTSVLRQRLDGLIKTCRDKIHPADLWKYFDSTDGNFVSNVQSCFATTDLPYPYSWNFKCISVTDRDSIINMFHYSRFREDFSGFEDHVDKHASMMVLMLFCHGDRSTLPKSANADVYGLWPFFATRFPASAEEMVKKKLDQRAAAMNKKIMQRKRNADGCDGEDNENNNDAAGDTFPKRTQKRAKRAHDEYLLALQDGIALLRDINTSMGEIKQRIASTHASTHASTQT